MPEASETGGTIAPVMITSPDRTRSPVEATRRARWATTSGMRPVSDSRSSGRSEEHTSELQSQSNLVCRLLLEKKKKKYNKSTLHISNVYPVTMEPMATV